MKKDEVQNAFCSGQGEAYPERRKYAVRQLFRMSVPSLCPAQAGQEHGTCGM